jgi:hypothetical protein
MAREPLRREVDRTVRCGNGHEFTVKQVWKGHDAGEEVGYSQGITWAEGEVEPIVACPVPNCRSTDFKLVEE